MRAQSPKIGIAKEQLMGICAELDRLVRRVDSICKTALTVKDVAAPRAEPAAQSAPVPPTVRRLVPPVPGLRTNPGVIAKLKAALGVGTKEAGRVAGAVVGALEESLMEHIDDNGYSIKVGKFGKFSIRHRPGGYRKIPLTGETRMSGMKRKVKFVAIGRLRKLERVGSGR